MIESGAISLMPVCKPMEGTVKGRPRLTGALFLFAQIKATLSSGPQICSCC
jgi:hypothetical protein